MHRTAITNEMMATAVADFMISNYQGQEAVDNDDGSAYYQTHHNFLVYSGNGMKNDFGKHSSWVI